jgi:hypothetical protein
MPLERVFIDTNILVSAVACDRNERKLLHMAAEGEAIRQPADAPSISPDATRLTTNN